MSIYKVTGRLNYRGHPPGATFEARLPLPAEARAVRRGSIRLVKRSDPALEPGSYRLPLKPK